MFEIARRPRDFSPIREMVEALTQDPFFQISSASFDENGNLPVDIVEGDNELVVHASLPGFGKDDVDVQLHDGVLSINAKRTEETESKEEHYYRRERRVGAVSRRISLPGVVSEAKAEAELSDGVLTVHIPRAKVATPKQISIK